MPINFKQPENSKTRSAKSGFSFFKRQKQSRIHYKPVSALDSVPETAYKAPDGIQSPSTKSTAVVAYEAGRPSTEATSVFGRSSFSPSVAASQYYILPESSVYGEFKMKYHKGPIDKNALTSRPPLQLILEIERKLRACGYKTQLHPRSNFKIRVLKPQIASKVPIYHNMSTTQSRSAFKSGSTRPSILRTLQAYPKNIIDQFRLFAEHGSSWNKGFDGKSHVRVQRSLMIESSDQQSSISHPNENQIAGYTDKILKEIAFTVEIQKIQNLRGLFVVEFKRTKGDIWDFKKLYQALIIQLPLTDD